MNKRTVIAAAAIVAAGCGGGKGTVQLHSTPPTYPPIHQSSTSVLVAGIPPACQNPGIQAAAQHIADVAKTNMAAAEALLKAAPLPVQQCWNTPTVAGSDMTGQQVSP